MKTVDLNSLAMPKTITRPEAKTDQRNDILSSFGDVLKDAISKTNDQQLEADTLMEKLATGEAKNIHEVMIGVTKAEVSLQFLLELRNKLVEFYKEIMRMPV